MITRTLQLSCDHEGRDVCTRFLDGQPGESRAMPLIQAARRLGWIASNGWQFCPDHREEGLQK